MIVDNLGLTDDQRKSVKEIVTAIEAYVNGQINESVVRRAFRSRTQQDGETFDDFLVSLRELAKTCNFCDDACTQKNVRDQIIAGLTDGEAVEDLLKEKNSLSRYCSHQMPGARSSQTPESRVSQNPIRNLYTRCAIATARG